MFTASTCLVQAFDQVNVIICPYSLFTVSLISNEHERRIHTTGFSSGQDWPCVHTENRSLNLGYNLETSLAEAEHRVAVLTTTVICDTCPSKGSELWHRGTDRENRDPCRIARVNGYCRFLLLAVLSWFLDMACYLGSLCPPQTYDADATMVGLVGFV